MELFAFGAIGFYALAIFQSILVITEKQALKTRKIFVLSAIATLLHLFWVGFEVMTPNGLNLSIMNVAAVVSMIISIIMTLSINKLKVITLLPVAFGFSALIVALTYFLPSIYISDLSGNTPLITHIVLTLLAYASFLVASLLALQMAYLDYQLKHKRALAMHPALPSLMTIERQLIRLLVLGMCLLSVSLTIGLTFLDNPFSHTQSHKTVLSIIAWCFYAVLLWGHFKQGWRNTKIIFGTLIGTSLLSLAYFGSRVVKELLLG